MRKQKENIFSNKFRLLNSQENTVDINWSSSESSEFEELSTNTNFCNITNKKTNRKRKRKSKELNISNLDVTIIEANKDNKLELSPIINVKSTSSVSKKIEAETSIRQEYPTKINNRVIQRSPVIISKFSEAKLTEKSPVIPQKYASPVNSPRVKKVLFSKTKIDSVEKTSESPVLNSTLIENRRTTEKVTDNDEFIINEKSETKSQEILPSVRQTHKTDCDLVKKVKSFFDSELLSENSSQYSIADTPTPKNTSSDDIEITNSLTQVPSTESLKSCKGFSTDNSGLEMKLKKVKYKKDGLAFRLDALLKKHNASIALWQHERFLAENSEFIIPKGEHIVFRIINVHFKYGSYLLQVKDMFEQNFVIIINNEYKNNCSFAADYVFKLYEPYKMYDYDGKNKFIINVCKFECFTLSL